MNVRGLLVLLMGAAILAAVGLFIGGYVRNGPLLLSAGSVVLITFGVLFALVSKRERRAAYDAEEAATSARVHELGPVRAPLVVPQGDTSGPYQACMRCGSLKLSPAFLAGALFPDAYRCERCGHKGPALTLETAADYQRYLEGLAADHGVSAGTDAP